ncbi:MAG: hypothetical protein HRT61_18165 [Ekhidna sp.]|nr:hypothetical protein [Ekhidna sp.]
MKIILIVSSLFLLRAQSFSQQFDPRTIDFYKMGTRELENGNYNLADSLLSMGLFYQKSPEVYYKAGVVKLLLGDTLSSCRLMNILKSENDENGKNLYYRICATVDTSYYNKNFTPTTEKKRKYTFIREELNYADYNLITIEGKRDISYRFKHFEPLEMVSSKAIAVYRETETSKIFTYCLKEPYPINEQAHFKFKTDNKYEHDLIVELGLDYKLTITLNLIIDQTGHVTKGELFDHFYRSPVQYVLDEGIIESYIEQIVDEWPPYYPAKHLNRPVVFQKQETISIN